MIYESMPGIRRSDLWYINKSPMHFKYHMENPEEPTPALLFGIAAHKMILEPGSFSDEFAIAPQVDRRTKEGKQIWAEFCDECNDNDLTVISKDDFEKICTMDDAIDLNPAARQLLTGDHEQIFTWTDPQTGEECKVKVDCLTEYKGKKYIFGMNGQTGKLMGDIPKDPMRVLQVGAGVFFISQVVMMILRILGVML